MRGLENQVVVSTAEELGEGDFALTDLRGCTVFLLGPLSALRIHKLRGCQVLTGPVAGATFIEGTVLFSSLRYLGQVLQLGNSQFLLSGAQYDSASVLVW